MKQLAIQTFEGGAVLVLPQTTTRESLDLIIKCLELQKPAFPTREEIKREDQP
jgi:hypothetical protein